MKIISVAAMFVVILGVGTLIGLQINNNQNPYNNANLNEFVEAEKYYNRQIENMWTTVKAVDQEESRSLENELSALDEVYDDLKSELLNDPGSNADVIVNAMIQNYRDKIEILESVLEKYKQKTNQQINIEDDKIEI